MGYAVNLQILQKCRLCSSKLLIEVSLYCVSLENAFFLLYFMLRLSFLSSDLPLLINVVNNTIITYSYISK